MMTDIERREFFEMMRQIHADKALRAKVVADARQLATDPVWCAERAARLRTRAASIPSDGLDEDTSLDVHQDAAVAEPRRK
jgi:hypothetical protein